MVSNSSKGYPGTLKELSPPRLVVAGMERVFQIVRAQAEGFKAAVQSVAIVMRAHRKHFEQRGKTLVRLWQWLLCSLWRSS